MLTSEQNLLLCETGPGTPMAEVMRRYWQPVGLSDEITRGGKPKQIKVMGEDLVLFRDDNGKPGLLGLHCSHRLTSLAYGRVEDGGLRCPFHGWLYDIDGKCLDQPAEPGPFTERVRHQAYPCEESGGLVFAYMGPADKKPLLPPYEVLVREDGNRNVNYYQINSNYLQNLEGAVDTIHVPYLHMQNWSQIKHKLALTPKPKVEFATTHYGICQNTFQPEVTIKGGVVHMASYQTHFIMPNGWLRTLAKGGWLQVLHSWYVPIDDTKTARFQVGFAPMGKDGERYEWPDVRNPAHGIVQPGPENEYFRNYEEVDTISGIPSDSGGSATKRFVLQDSMVNETQGAIVDRRQEHLGVHDKVLMAIRTMLLLAIEEVRKGHEPKHILREPGENRILYIRDVN